MDHAIQIAILLLILLHHRTLTSAADYSPEMLPSAACSDKLVTFSSSCLPFIAIFPQNLTAFPPPQCCDDFSAAVGGDSAVCLLYAALKQKIVEFPIDSTKLLSLASVCPLKDRKSKTRISNGTLCSGGESPAAQESSDSELPSLSSLPVKISSAAGNINDAPPMQQSPSVYPPETNFSAAAPSGDLSTLPDLARAKRRPPKPPSPPKKPSEPSPRSDIPFIEPINPQGPSYSQSTNLATLSPSFLTGFVKSLFMLVLI